MLKKLFIKNYENIEDPNVRNQYGIVAGTFGIISNFIFGIIKLIIGAISKSVSIMADAVNNLSDTASSIITIVGFKLSSKKPTRNHPYGYARYEYISGLVIAILMLIMGGLFIKESIQKIINPQNLKINYLTFTVLIITILGKILQCIVYLDFSKITKSTALKTAAVDSKNDVITTTAIFISMIVMKIFNINIDGYLGLIVSVFVINSSVKMIKEVLEPIVGIIPSQEYVDEVKQRLLYYDYVKGIHDMVIHNYGVHNDFVTVHVEMDSNLSMLEAHDLIDNIENDFKENMGINLTIHMDPVVIGNPKVDELKEKVIDNIKSLDKDLQIHDFRMIEQKEYTKVLFDCVVPHEKDYTQEDIEKYLSNNIKDKKLKFIIEIDRPFC